MVIYNLSKHNWTIELNSKMDLPIDKTTLDLLSIQTITALPFPVNIYSFSEETHQSGHNIEGFWTMPSSRGISLLSISLSFLSSSPQTYHHHHTMCSLTFGHSTENHGRQRSRAVFCSYTQNFFMFTDPGWAWVLNKTCLEAQRRLTGSTHRSRGERQSF